MANQEHSEGLGGMLLKHLAARLVLIGGGVIALGGITSVQLSKAKVERAEFVHDCAIDLIVMNDRYDDRDHAEQLEWCSDFADRGGEPPEFRDAGNVWTGRVRR